jgi:hypothetical protein
MDTEHFCEVKNFNELYSLIKSDFEYNCRIYGPDSLGSSDYSDAARLTYVRIRRSVLAENPSLGIPNVPQSADAVSIMDCCTDAQIIIKTSALPKLMEQGTTIPLSKAMSKESMKADLASLKPAETEQLSKSRRIWICLTKIPRWIYVLVLFLAALLTCIYFLWWLWTTFWKK